MREISYFVSSKCSTIQLMIYFIKLKLLGRMRLKIIYVKCKTHVLGVLQKSVYNLRFPYSKNYEINSKQFFTFVKIFHCLHREVCIDQISWDII